MAAKRTRPLTPQLEEERIDFVVGMLQQRMSPSEIKRALYNAFKIKYRRAEDYCSRARQRLLERAGTTKPERQLQAVEFYEWMVSNPQFGPRDRLNAQEKLVDLLNLRDRDPADAAGSQQPVYVYLNTPVVPAGPPAAGQPGPAADVPPVPDPE